MLRPWLPGFARCADGFPDATDRLTPQLCVYRAAAPADPRLAAWAGLCQALDVHSRVLSPAGG